MKKRALGVAVITAAVVLTGCTGPQVVFGDNHGTMSQTVTNTGKHVHGLDREGLTRLIRSTSVEKPR